MSDLLESLKPTALARLTTDLFFGTLKSINESNDSVKPLEPYNQRSSGISDSIKNVREEADRISPIQKIRAA